jgi:hypothetical protein
MVLVALQEQMVRRTTKLRSFIGFGVPSFHLLRADPTNVRRIGEFFPPRAHHVALSPA